MSYSDLIKPRPEVLSERGIEGIIDLANLSQPKKKVLEKDPKRFFELTYPSADVRRVVSLLHQRFQKGGETPGLFLFEGLKGSGKSHLLLLIYHLINSPEEAKVWLRQNGMECEVPEGIITVINKFTDLPLRSIWDFILGRLGSKTQRERDVQPGLQEMEQALGNRTIFLIFDELEQGIRVIRDNAARAQNIAFLQMLSEWGNRDNRVTLFSSIYSDQDEPGSTLKRVPCCRVQFSHSEDRNKIVLHRLFLDYQNFDTKAADPVIDSYINVWKPHVKDLDRYRVILKESFPFNPDIFDIILNRVPARGGFQEMRGALGFLANMVRITHQKTDLITAAHASLRDRETIIRLADLDTSGDLVSKARANLEELKDRPLSSEIAATTLVYTLTGTTKTIGADREDLIRNVMAPGSDINDFDTTLTDFQKYASHFWYRENRYFFDPEENADAKVEYRSLKVDKGEARKLLAKIWQEEVFKEPQAVIFSDEEKTREALSSLDKGRIRFILSPRRLKPEERHSLYFGIDVRNQVILLEPKDPSFDLSKNPDLLKWACRQIAAQSLEGLAKDADRKVSYQRIMKEDRKNCIEAIRKAGLIFVQWDKFGSSPGEDIIEEEPIPGVLKDDVLKHLSQQIFPVQLFEEHMKGRLSDLMGKTVKNIDQEYKNTLGFPIPTFQAVTKAIRNLCGEKSIGVFHSRGNFCTEDPPLSEHELLEATIQPPFEPGKREKPPKAPEEERSKGEKEKEIPPPKDEVPSFEEREEETLPQSTLGELRKVVAQKLQELGEGCKVRRLRFHIYLDQEVGDLSAFPSGLRGNLSGGGTLTVEINIGKSGEFSKAEAERLVENLPNISMAEYKAKIKVLVPKPKKDLV